MTSIKELCFVPVAKTSDISQDEPRRVMVGDQAIALYNLSGVFHATDDCCSHGMASLARGFIDGPLIECPLHGGAFDIATGKAVKAPCVEDIRIFEVRVEGDMLYVGVPQQ
jgi:nitrite reductase/ring-hydroxylating ferredoxin subunit